MAENIDKEIARETEAIRAVVQALEPLPPDVRAHVIGYVLTRLGIVLPSGHQAESLRVTTRLTDATPDATGAGRQVTPTHIGDLKNQKKPRSASEMAAIVAYYLENLAPSKERKDRVTAKDMETYFKIADYPLPEIQFTLPNAKAAGYLDAVGNGEYKLNAVGHNLVVHSLPRGAESKKASRRRRVKKGRRPTKKP